MQWIKKMEIVDSMDGFQCQILKYLMRGLLQHWTKSSLFPSSKEESVWRNKKPQKRTVPFVEGQIAYFIYEYFPVTGATDSVENYTDFFTIVLRNDDIQEFDSKWDDKLNNTRVWETQERVGIVWPGDSWEEVRSWLSQIENFGDEKYRAKKKTK